MEGEGGTRGGQVVGGGVRREEEEVGHLLHSVNSGRLLQSVTSLKETESCQYNWLKLLLFDGVILYALCERIG
jgi:hypothetical protein